ncbi:MAG: SRPBCC family protein [Proteobacteria bacterium]|nr:SRPBCC family protein [Pseudomonadota bacterium]
MTLSIDRFHLFARLVGALLTLMGTGLLAVFGAYYIAGLNLLAPAILLDPAGVLILATVGAFQVPLGLSLLGRDARTSFRLRVAAGAFAGMGALRLMAFAQPEMQATLGVTPLIEGLLFSGIAGLALVLRPEGESPIEIVREFDIPAPAAEVWHVVGTRFDQLADYASGVRAVEMEGPVCVGATRTCHSEPFGPFDSARINETLVEFDPAGMRLTYTADGELPSFIPSSRNRWSVQAVGPSRCRVRSHASVDLVWWATPFAPLLGWFISGAVDQFGVDLGRRMEGVPAGPPVPVAG